MDQAILDGNTLAHEKDCDDFNTSTQFGGSKNQNENKSGGMETFACLHCERTFTKKCHLSQH